MPAQDQKKLNSLSGRFASAGTESAYKNFVYKRNLTSNVWASLLGLSLFIIYVFSDYIDAVNPREVISIRIIVFAASLLLLSLLTNKRLTRYHDFVTTVVIILMGAGINLIVWLQPSLENTYYIALIQGYILFSLLLRLSYPSMVVVFACTQTGFAIAAFSKADISAAILQSSNVGMVGLIAVVGVYLLQRYQRVDFLKTQTISEQNAQLNELLDDARRDNQRKVAALNMLVHFVKTPLHQISGFSDIVMNSLNGDFDRESTKAGMEGARYIKDATANLANSVNSLLIYHRLDEVESRKEAPSSIADAVADLAELINVEIDVSKEGSIGEIRTYEYAVKTAIQRLADYYNGKPNQVTSLAIALERCADVASVALIDNGAPISTEQFAEETKPLTMFDNYLTGQGSDMPMALRTVARAAEVCGGEFRHEELPIGNKFVLSFKDTGAAPAKPGTKGAPVAEVA